MSNAYYKLYIENTLQLAETIVIKSERTADVLNDVIVKNYGDSFVNPSAPSTWKYYQNICGDYHVTDTPIIITSLDTAQEIIFNKTNLELHPTTARAYRFGSRYYRELMLEYPEQEMLILGVLYPAVMADAIAAPDGSVLAYPQYLVEDTEPSLIPNIETWTRKYRIRYYNKQYNNSHELFDTSHQGVMFLSIVPHILNLRTQSCKTDEAHSFHIREYLASHGMLDRFLDSMTRKQALFFYRNIAYIERNSGKQDVFEWLVQKVLTDRNLPLVEYTMRHNTSDLLNTLLPEIAFKANSINNVFGSVDESTKFSLSDILEKEYPLAPDNPYFSRINYNKINNLFVDSLSSVVQTKVLECNVTDYSDSSRYSKQDIALNHWAFMAASGLYTAIVRITDPKDGSEIVLTAKDAFVYFIYALSKMAGTNYVLVPTFGALRVNPITPVTVAYLKPYCDSKYVSDETLGLIVDKKIPLVHIGSTEVFTELVRKLYDISEFEVGMTSLQEHEYSRDLLEIAINNTYINTPLEFEDQNKTFESWLAQRSLPTEFSDEEWKAVFNNLFESATGVNVLSNSDSAALLRAMIGIMRQVSSYSIQFISDINADTIKPIFWSMIRLGDKEITVVSDVDVYDTRIDVLETISVQIESDIDFPITPVLVQPDISVVSEDEAYIDVDAGISQDEYTNVAEYDLGIGTVMIGLDPDPSWGVAPYRILPSYQPFYELTPEQQLSLKDMYHDYPIVRENTQIDTDDVLLRDTIRGFKYLDITNKVIRSFRYRFIPLELPFGVRPVIDTDLGSFEYTGGSGTGNGFTYMGFSTSLDLFQYTGDIITVDGMQFDNSEVALPYEALKYYSGIGINLPEIAISYSHAYLKFNSVFHKTGLDVNYIRHTATLPDLSFVQDHYSFISDQPFWSDPASYNHPHYILGEFIVDGTNKVDFIVS